MTCPEKDFNNGIPPCQNYYCAFSLLFLSLSPSPSTSSLFLPYRHSYMVFMKFRGRIWKGRWSRERKKKTRNCHKPSKVSSKTESLRLRRDSWFLLPFFWSRDDMNLLKIQVVFAWQKIWSVHTEKAIDPGSLVYFSLLYHQSTFFMLVWCVFLSFFFLLFHIVIL